MCLFGVVLPQNAQCRDSIREDSGLVPPVQHALRQLQQIVYSSANAARKPGPSRSTHSHCGFQWTADAASF